jgi:hypothetical protein
MFYTVNVNITKTYEANISNEELDKIVATYVERHPWEKADKPYSDELIGKSIEFVRDMVLDTDMDVADTYSHYEYQVEAKEL